MASPQIMFLPQQQTQTSTNQLPQWVQDAGKSNFDLASQISNSMMGQYYQGPRVADLNAGLLGTISNIGNNVGSNGAEYQKYINNANSAVNNANQIMNSGINQIQSSLNPASVRDAITGINSQVGQKYSNIEYGGNPAQSGIDTMYNALRGSGASMNTAQGMIGQAYNPVYQATNPAISALQNSIQNARQLQGYTPQQINAQSVPQGDLSSYMNRFTNDVINSSLATLDQQRKQALNTGADQAINAKAFGGSRQAIQDAATNAQYGMQGAQLAANLNNQNYNQALAAMQADQARNLQAQQANQSAGLQGAQLAQSANQLGQSAANQLGSLGLNTGAFNINAGNAFGNLGMQNAQLGASVGNNVGQMGLTNQGQQIQAQQANQNAALQNQANNVDALQSVGSLGLNNAQLGVNAGNQISNVGKDIGNLGLQGATTSGALTGAQQSDYRNQLSDALDGYNILQNKEQDYINSGQQLYQDAWNSYINPLNLRMQALGMTPYNTSTTSTSSGISAQPYQPTSSSPFMGALGGGLAGAQFGPWGAAAGAGLGLLSGLRR